MTSDHYLGKHIDDDGDDDEGDGDYDGGDDDGDDDDDDDGDDNDDDDDDDDHTYLHLLSVTSYCCSEVCSWQDCTLVSALYRFGQNKVLGEFYRREISSLVFVRLINSVVEPKRPTGLSQFSGEVTLS